MKTAFVCTVVFFGLLISGCTEAPPAPPRFGAIAYSPLTQKWHIRWNVVIQERVNFLAKSECAELDCRIILSFGPKQCGTFSLGDKGAVGVGTGATGTEAESAALADCERSGQKCKVAAPRCNL